MVIVKAVITPAATAAAQPGFGSMGGEGPAHIGIDDHRGDKGVVRKMIMSRHGLPQVDSKVML